MDRTLWARTTGTRKLSPMKALRATTDVVKQARGVVRNLTQIANEVGKSVEALANELTGLAKEVGLESLGAAPDAAPGSGAAPDAASDASDAPAPLEKVVDAEFVVEQPVVEDKKECA